MSLTGILVVLSLSLLLVSPHWCHGDLVVLTDRRALQADSVTFEGDRVTVTLPSGNWISFAASRVARVIADDERSGIPGKAGEAGTDGILSRRARVSALRGPDVPYWDIIEDTARRYGMNPVLITALIQVESGFDPEAVSHKGAAGLMQIMPETAASFRLLDPFDPKQNIEAGVRYLDILLKRFNGDTGLALAAYNAGPEVVQRYKGIPPYRETTRYVQRILEIARSDSRS